MCVVERGDIHLIQDGGGIAETPDVLEIDLHTPQDVGAPVDGSRIVKSICPGEVVVVRLAIRAEDSRRIQGPVSSRCGEALLHQHRVGQ